MQKRQLSKQRKQQKKNQEKTDALIKAIETHNLDVTRGKKMYKFIDSYDPNKSTKKLASDFIKYIAQRDLELKLLKSDLKSKTKQHLFQRL